MNQCLWDNRIYNMMVWNSSSGIEQHNVNSWEKDNDVHSNAYHESWMGTRW